MLPVFQHKIHGPVKLGRHKSPIDKRTLKFKTYSKKLDPPPQRAGYGDAIAEWGMMGNDNYGDCAFACPGHQVMDWTNAASSMFTPTTEQILAAYSAVTGFNPADPSTDNGAYPLQVLKYWKKTGIAGHFITAFVQLDPQDDVEIKQAINLFGSVYVGLELPVSAQDPIQGHNGLPCWNVPPSGPSGDGEPGSWGGHAVPIIGYGVDSAGNAGMEVVTWGAKYDMTWQFLKTYCDEAWAIVTVDWIKANGKSPSGFDITALLKDLSVVSAKRTRRF